MTAKSSSRDFNVCFCYFFLLFWSVKWNKLSLIFSFLFWILRSLFFFSYICQCIFIIGDSLILLSFIVFIIEFFRIRLKQLSIESINLFKNSFQSSNRKRKLFWYRFHSQYVYLYSETHRFNLILRDVLLFLEMMSKSLVVICLLYYNLAFYIICIFFQRI